MEADDMMAAVFPQAAACQDNRVGPVEIPDHVIVRQTISDTLHEALDVDGLRVLLERIERGEVRVHTVDSTEPSVLAHEILTSRPYTFLDDEEFVNRRTRALNLRRGLSVELETIGRLDADAIRTVHAEITPRPETADDLHDLLCSVVTMPPQPRWTDLWAQLVDTGRGRFVTRAGRKLWVATEMLDDAQRLAEGDDAATTAAVRGHLELVGITTADEITRATGLERGRVEYALMALQGEGFAIQGSFEGDGPAPQWVSRRLLARMHSYARKRRRSRVEPATAQDFMRFLLRWQHLAPGTQLNAIDGLGRVITQLQGWEAAAAAWEPELIGRRVRNYQAHALDRLCHEGEIGWLRLAPPDRDVDAPAGAPNRATPISVVFRADLPWLLEVARERNDPEVPNVGATAEVIAQLRERGACFAAELAQATGRLPEDVARGLWDGVSRGLLTADGFNAIRARVDKGRRDNGRVDNDPTRLSRLMRAARPKPAAAGRWSLVPSRHVTKMSLTSTATSSPKQSPRCCSIGGVWCSATSPVVSRCGSPGARCSGPCGASKIAASCMAADS
jgi:ATP-dependent Lhr-like helicase